MFTFIKSTIIALLVLLITGCISPVIVKKEYSDTDLSTNSILVRVVDDTFDIDYTGDLTNEFGNNNVNDSIRTFFVNSLENNLKKGTNFEDVKLKCGYDRLSSATFAYPHYENGVKVDSLILHIPDGQSYNSTDLTVLLQNVIIESPIQFWVGAAPVLGGIVFGEMDKSLNITSDLIYWDNRQNKIIAFGRVTSKTDDGMCVDSKTWERAMKDLTLEMLDVSPFENTIKWNYLFTVRNKTDNADPGEAAVRPDSRSYGLKPLPKEGR